MLKEKHRRVVPVLICVALLLLLVVLMIGLPGGVAQADPAQPGEPCPYGLEVDGIPLDQCHFETFEVGGQSKTVTIWYTLDKTPQVVDTDPGPATALVTLTHGLDSSDQAEYGGELAREAWEAYHRVFDKSPRNTGPGCDNDVDVWVYDIVGPSVAPWPSDVDDCRIEIDVAELRGDPRYPFQHELFHTLQYAYDDGCYDFQYSTYERGIWSGSADFVEGYADLATDIVTQSMDDLWFEGFVNKHRHWRSIYHESYWNLFTKYFAEQVGTEWDTGDPEYHMDAVREHYEACDAQDTLYVLEDLVPQLTGGALTMEQLVLNFFAANYVHKWDESDPYPELSYVDHGTPDYGSARYIERVDLTPGLTETHSWHGDFVLTRQEDGLYNNWEDDTMPDGLEPMPQEWAAYYYRAYPDSGCDYVTAHVDGEPGARLGINLIARNANPNVADYFRRFSWIGEDFSRTFHRRSGNFPIAAIVNSFDSVHEYDVTFSCVTPVVDILEPRRVDFALVDRPANPTTFLLRFEVLSDGSPVRGLTESDVEVWVGGQAASLVGGTWQEVGEAYWAVVQPPAASAGTTWADLDVVIQGGAGDSEKRALLYVEPGHSDIALLFDASSSMDTEDVVGEGKRFVNARKAGTIVADLLRDGDRVTVMDFSATGTNDPTYDIRTLLPLTEVEVPDTIDEAKDAIDQISPRNKTPIGKALLEAKDELVAAGSTNPKTIILLSDGEENVRPYWREVEDEIKASGVVVDTIAFSGEADPSLMAEIAAKTGGTYRYVPTGGGSLAGVSALEHAKLGSLGLPAEIASRLSTAALPGPLGLDEVYDYYEAKSQGASRLFLSHYPPAGNDEFVTAVQYVDSSATQLRFVVASKQPHGMVSTTRYIEVQRPGAGDWVVVSSIMGPGPLPSGWSVRESTYDHVVVIADPDPGIWRVRAKGIVFNRAQVRPQAATFDFMLSGSVQSDIRLQGRLMAPIVDNKGLVGDHVPIFATLLDDDRGVAGATVLAVVEGPSATYYVALEDDGQYDDGSADDGVYAGLFSQTDQPGTYNVRIVAAWREGGTGDWLTREWTGAFWLRGIERPGDDSDGDNMPDWWEEAHGLDTSQDDAQEDLDLDGLKNTHELQVGARPNQSDTDHGGENDYSEAQRGRDPADPADDQVENMGVVTIMVYNGTAVIYWPYADRFGNMQLWVSTDPEDKGSELNIGTTGVYSLTGLTNDQTYYLRLAPIGLDGLAVGDLTPPMPVVPRADPDAPNGTILIDGGARSTTSKNVVLSITATDVPLDGPAAAASGAVANRWTEALNEVSGEVEMRLSNEESFAGIDWEPYVFQKAWTLGDSDSQVHRVYAQFRDAAGNTSTVAWDDIIHELQVVYLPLVTRSR